MAPTKNRMRPIAAAVPISGTPNQQPERACCFENTQRGHPRLRHARFGHGDADCLFQRFPSDVVFRPLPPTTPQFRLSLAWRRDNESALLKAFLEILRARLGK